MVMLIVYVNDIGVISNDDQEIKNLKTLFGTEFEIKDLNALKYFCEIEVAISKEGIVISPGSSQRSRKVESQTDQHSY